MTRLIIVFLLTSVIGVNVIAQNNNNKTHWKMISSEFLSSFGTECDILVIKDHRVVRDVLLFSPSLSSILNAEGISGEKILINATINKNGEKYLFGEISIRIYNKTTIVNDNILTQSIIKRFKTVNVEALKITTNQSFYNFGTIFLNKE